METTSGAMQARTRPTVAIDDPEYHRAMVAVGIVESMGIMPMNADNLGIRGLKDIPITEERMVHPRDTPEGDTPC